MRRQAARGIAQVVGGGLCGPSAALALARLGWQTTLCAPSGRGSLPIALNSAACYLLDRIWGPDPLGSMPRHCLERRTVIWRSRDPIHLMEATTVVDASVLAERMVARAVASGVSIAGDAHDTAQGWTIIATGRNTEGGYSHAAGTRVAVVAPVALAATADAKALTIEAVTQGWLALVPTRSDGGVLFACGLPATMTEEEALPRFLAETTTVRRAVVGTPGPCRVLAMAPRLRNPLWRDARSVFAGDAALAFDPLSGDGAGVALRTAHLSASMAEAWARGADLEDLRAFYSYRLARAMAAHLQGLLTLYAQAPFAAAWGTEIAAMRAMANEIEAGVADADRVPMFAISEAGLRPLDTPPGPERRRHFSRWSA